MKLRRSAIFIAANRERIKLRRSGIFRETLEDVAPDGAWKFFPAEFYKDFAPSGAGGFCFDCLSAASWDSLAMISRRYNFISSHSAGVSVLIAAKISATVLMLEN